MASNGWRWIVCRGAGSAHDRLVARVDVVRAGSVPPRQRERGQIRAARSEIHQGARGVHIMKTWLTCYSRGTLILLLTASAAWAQATAQMSGTVRDESGAVLPGVTVTVTQVDTSVTRTAVTDETGAYLLPNLPTGPYKLQVSLQGFRTYEQTGIVLQVGATPVI